MAKLNAELRKGNITGTGKKYRGRKVNAILPIIKPGSRVKKSSYMAPPMISGLLLALFERAGLPTGMTFTGDELPPLMSNGLLPFQEGDGSA